MAKHQPRKRFGQNFLRDQNVVDQIIHAIAPKQKDHVVEIGPGQGALTIGLLSCVNELDIIELDRDLIPQLKRLTEKASHLTVYQADALKLDFKSIVRNGQKLRIVGNLPYNISTPLLFHLFSQVEIIEDMFFMLQKEVVDRLAARVGTKAYGRLGIMSQYFCQIEKLFDVPASAFYPAPKVESAIVHLVPHQVSPYEKCDVDKLSKLIATAFSKRRKTIKNSLDGIIGAEQLASIGINPSLRAEQIMLEQYIKLCQCYNTAMLV